MKEALQLTKRMKTLEPMIEVSLDAIAVLNQKSQVVFMNTAMRAILGVKSRILREQKRFCDVVTLSVCKNGCKIEEMMDSGKSLRLDETPAECQGKKLRMILKGVPIYEIDTDGFQKGPPIGAVITVRDSTGEIMLQAKYHKILKVLQDKETELDLVKRKIEKILTTG